MRPPGFMVAHMAPASATWRELSPSLPTVEIPSVALRPCLYFLFDDEELQYIGQARRPLNRIGSHSDDKEFNRVLVMPVTLERLNDEEGRLVRALRPPLNLAPPPTGVRKR